MKPLIDGDILRYEIGFAAEAGIRASSGDPEKIPSWDYVQECLDRRMDELLNATEADEAPIVFLTEGPTFREQIATKKEYKGHRPDNKPHHYANITAYMKGVWAAYSVDGLEADDVMAIEHMANPETIICTRDKDLRQVPGWLYSWELGKQPAFGPVIIDKTGSLSYAKGKLTGTGLALFYAQCMMGDSTDNIPGLPGIGAAKAYQALSQCKTIQDYRNATEKAYEEHYGSDWEGELLEQGRLLWMVRKLNPDGSPVIWEIGMEE